MGFYLLHQTVVTCAEAVKFVLKAKPQSIVADADDSIDLNPRDAVIHEVRLTEAGQQEITTGSEPVGEDTGQPQAGPARPRRHR